METLIDEVGRRKFRIEASLRTDVDARNIQPLQIPRGLGAAHHPGDPMAPGWTKHAGFVGERPRKPADQASAEDSLDPTRPRGEEK